VALLVFPAVLLALFEFGGCKAADGLLEALLVGGVNGVEKIAV